MENEGNSNAENRKIDKECLKFDIELKMQLPRHTANRTEYAVNTREREREK